jgi:predicted secreted protein
VPIALASCLLAWRSSHTTGDPGAGVVERWTVPARLRRLLAATALAAALVFLFYSSFLTDLSGLSAWAASFPIYGERGLGGGNHAHGWGYYLRLLAYSHAEGTTWTEALVLGLAAVGLAFAVRRTAGFWPRYLALYALVTALAFSVLPYKTPWNLLPFYVGVLALAGCGAARLLEVAPSRPARLVVVLVLVAASAQLASQAWRANFRYAADPRNPYVNAHTSPDLLRLARRITDIARARGDREPTLVKVVAGPYEQWPLPWYLRRMSLVGYWTSAAAAAPLAGSPVIVSSEENAPAVDAAVGDAYVTEFYGLRPGVLLTLYIERGAWEAFMAGRR